jgi:predicted restriction endonuclease
MNLTEAELFQNLEQVWSRLGRQPRYSEMSKPLSMYSVGTYEKRFGGWRKALNLFVDFMEGTGVSVVNSTPTQDQRGVTARSHRTSRSINWRLRFIVLRRDNFKCVACGRSPATDPSIILQPDHMKPWAKGGETTLDNLQTLCSVCNIGKSDMHD